MKNERNTKSPLEYHSNSCCEQVPPVSAKIGWKSEQKGIWVQFQMFSSKILTNYIENNSNFRADKPNKRHLKVSG